jgi:hypothetical protein
MIAKFTTFIYLTAYYNISCLENTTFTAVTMVNRFSATVNYDRKLVYIIGRRFLRKIEGNKQKNLTTQTFSRNWVDI